MSTIQKIEIAKFILRQSTQEYSKNQSTSEKIIDRLKTLTESADKRITEIQKNAHDFQNEVVQSAKDNNSAAPSISSPKVILQHLHQKVSVISSYDTLKSNP